ncbi:hypothetical protein IWQ56_000483, partial [Coemansia nantahalensis]
GLMYRVDVVIPSIGMGHRPVKFSFESARPTLRDIVERAAKRNIHICEIFYVGNFAYVDGTLKDRPKWETFATLKSGRTTAMIVELRRSTGDTPPPANTRGTSNLRNVS